MPSPQWQPCPRDYVSVPGKTFDLQFATASVARVCEAVYHAWRFSRLPFLMAEIELSKRDVVELSVLTPKVEIEMGHTIILKLGSKHAKYLRAVV